MRIYTVHLRHQGVNADQDFVLVREGFSWAAFFFGPVWALWNGLWKEALAMLGVFIFLAVALPFLGLNEDAFSIVWLGYATLIGFMADDLKRCALGKQGMSAAAVIAGKDEDEATRRFLDANPSFARELLV